MPVVIPRLQPARGLGVWCLPHPVHIWKSSASRTGCSWHVAADNGGITFVNVMFLQPVKDSLPAYGHRVRFLFKFSVRVAGKKTRWAEKNRVLFKKYIWNKILAKRNWQNGILYEVQKWDIHWTSFSCDVQKLQRRQSVDMKECARCPVHTPPGWRAGVTVQPLLPTSGCIVRSFQRRRQQLG